jgi:hypothetical protein
MFLCNGYNIEQGELYPSSDETDPARESRSSPDPVVWLREVDSGSWQSVAEVTVCICNDVLQWQGFMVSAWSEQGRSPAPQQEGW